MRYHYEQLNDERWGIFVDDRLVASIGCFDTCKKIIKALETRSSNQNIHIRNNNIVSSYFYDLKLRP